MKPDEQRIAIAKACEWITGALAGSDYQFYGWQKSGSGPMTEGSADRIPDYLNDLNAMHEAEAILNHSQLQAYGGYLEAAVCLPDDCVCINSGDPSGSCDYAILVRIARTTAAQRAESFLRALNLWIK